MAERGGNTVRYGQGAAQFSEQLMHWTSRSPGRELVERECRCLDSLLSDLFGYYLLQVGWTREFAPTVSQCRIRHHLSLEADFPGLGSGKTLLGDQRAFPVAADSMDAVLLPHTLDFALDPHQVLRETERVLIPEGRIVIFGFNPWSSWGAWRLFRRKRVPWCGHFLSPRRVADWLTLLGFDIEIQTPLMFLPPLSNTAMLRQFAPMESLGNRWLPLFSGAYAIRGVKRVSTLTPLEPLWKRRGRMLPGQAVEPSARRGGARV